MGTIESVWSVNLFKQPISLIPSFTCFWPDLISKCSKSEWQVYKNAYIHCLGVVV